MIASESYSGGRRWALLVPTEAYSLLVVRVGNLYCQLFHRSISRPVNGRYRCWKCLREFELRW
jgi:hypothetical protein